MFSFSFLNTIGVSQFRLSTINIRRDGSVIAASMSHLADIHSYIPSDKSFWNLGIGFLLWRLRTSKVFSILALKCKADHISPFKSMVAAGCIQDSQQSSTVSHCCDTSAPPPCVLCQSHRSPLSSSLAWACTPLCPC